MYYQHSLKKTFLGFLLTLLLLISALDLILPTTTSNAQSGSPTPASSSPAPTPTPGPVKITGLTLGVNAGFDNYFKRNEWVPVQVTIAADSRVSQSFSGRIEASTSNFSSDSYLYTYPVEITPPTHKVIWLYVMGEKQLGYNLQVRLVRNDNVTVAETDSTLQNLPDNTLLMGVVSDDQSALDYLNTTASNSVILGKNASDYSSFLKNYYSYGGGSSSNSSNLANPTVAIVHFTPTTLPPSGAGLDALDALVISDLTTSDFSNSAVDQTAMFNALTSWLSQGHALIEAGDSSLHHAALFNSLLPVKDNGGPIGLSDLSDLQKRISSPIPLDLSGSGASITSAKVKAIGGTPGATILSSTSQGLPLVVTRYYGLGQVWFIAPELQPLANWKGMPAFWMWLLKDYNLHFSYASMVRHSNQDYNDNYSIMPNYPPVNLPNPGNLFIFLLTYLLIAIGLNILVLYYLKRLKWLWFSIPLLSVIFSVGAYVFTISNGVADLTVSRVTVLIAGQNSDGTIGGANIQLANIRSNGNNHFDLAVAPNVLTNGVLANDPNRYYGYYSNSYNLLNGTIEQGPTGGYKNLSIGAHSSPTFAFEGDNAGQILGNGMVSHIKIGSNGQLTGTITNQTHSDWSDAVVFVGNNAVKIGTIKAGQTLKLGQAVSSSTNLVSTITGYKGDPFQFNRFGYNSYLRSTGVQPPEVSRDMQETAVLSSLIGSNGDGLESKDSQLYLVAWSNNAPANFQPENQNESDKNLTLLLEPLAAD